MNEESMPLSIMLENAKTLMIDAFNQVQQKTNLPAYLMEGIILDLLAQIRNQKNVELVADMNRMKATKAEKKEGAE